MTLPSPALLLSYEIPVVVVRCFGFSGLLRQFSVNIGPSPSEREKQEGKDRGE